MSNNMMRLWRPASTVCAGCVPGMQVRLVECVSPAIFSRNLSRNYDGHSHTRAQSTGPSRATSTGGVVYSEWLVANPRLEEKINYVMKLYEDFIGLTEVKAAQAKVISAEFEFKSAQDARTGQQQRMMELQRQLREIHAELDKTVRGEDRHLQLITKEHAILKEERLLVTEFRATEKREHELFSLLSFALRESHEKERAQAEKTKYWSIIGSVVGTVIGIAATTISNQYRVHQLRKLVTDATSETAHCRDLIMQIREGLNEQNALLKGTTIYSSTSPSISVASTENTAETTRTGPDGVSVEGAEQSQNNETHVLVGPIDRLYERTVHLEGVVRQTSLVNTALISAMFVVVPLVGWLVSR